MITNRGKLLARPIVAALTAVVLAAPFASAQSTAPGCPGVVRRGEWLSVEIPRYRHGSQYNAAYAVDPVVPGRMFVTNGISVQATQTDGCTWDEVFFITDAPTADVPFTAANSTIESIAIQASRPTVPPQIMLRVEERQGLVPRPHVVVSSDGGETWRASDIGLPPAGAPDFLRVSEGANSVAYLGVATRGEGVPLVFASDDGGQTWQARTDLTNPKTAPQIDDIAVDPVDRLSLWGWGQTGLFHSTNGGQTWDVIREFDGQIVGPADVYHRPGQPAQVLAFRAENSDMMKSEKDGREGTFFKFHSPPAPDAVAHGLGPADLAASAGGRVYFYLDQISYWYNVNAPVYGIRALTSDRTTSPRFYGITSNSIEIYDGVPPRRRVPPTDLLVTVPHIVTPVEAPDLPNVLRPKEKTIRIPAGEHRKIPYRLMLPRTPLPIDVYFLVDTSGSMVQAIDGMRHAVANIINGLIERRVDARFGLAAYRSYPDRFPPRNEQQEPNYVYRQIIDIGPLNPAQFRDALSGLRAEGGGAYDAHLEALRQTAVGDGKDLYPPGPLGSDVPPGQEATWRGDAHRVVIHITDERFGKPTNEERDISDIQQNRNPEPPDIPSFAQVIAALNAKDIFQVGLSINFFPRPDLAKVARGTKATVRERGVDCDGDGDQELHVGQGLVCRLRDEELGKGDTLVPAIINLLDAVAGKSPVDIRVAKGDRVVGNVTPDGYSGVLLQSGNVLDFKIDYRCPLDLGGEAEGVRLEALTGDRLLAGASARIVCTESKEIIPLAPTIVELVVGALAPPPPPPPPITELSSASQAQSQAQAQGAAAFQEEEQPQFAFAAALREAQEEIAEEYAMSSYRARDEYGRDEWSPALFVVGVGAAALSLAYGWLQLARQRVRVQKVRVRS